MILRVVSSQALEAIFSKPESDGEDDVTLYKIEWDNLPEFDSNKIGSYSFVTPQDGCNPCTHQISGLTKKSGLLCSSICLQLSQVFN